MGDTDNSGQDIGRRRSARRDAITSVLGEATQAMTPAEIRAAAAKLIPGLGIATVYRNLKLLIEHGSAQQVLLPDGRTRYESTQKHHHHHFHCRRCGKAYCVDGCALHTDQSVTLPAGFVAEGHEISFFGICSACNARQE